MLSPTVIIIYFPMKQISFEKIILATNVVLTKLSLYPQPHPLFLTFCKSLECFNQTERQLNLPLLFFSDEQTARHFQDEPSLYEPNY